MLSGSGRRACRRITSGRDPVTRRGAGRLPARRRQHLLDNDAIVEELKRYLVGLVGTERASRYWVIFEDLRRELGYADYLGALQRWRLEDQGDPRPLSISSFLVDYPFSERLFPGVMPLLARLGERGSTVILTDGDVVFQPRKIQRSGLFQAVGGRVLIYVHKEQNLADIEKTLSGRPLCAGGRQDLDPGGFQAGVGEEGPPPCL